MAISPMQIISLAFKLVSKRDQIANIWTQISPLVTEIMGDPAVKNLLAAVPAPKVDDFNVQWLQQSLNKLSKAGLTVNGQYDDATKAAVSNYQKAHQLAVDGWAGVNTQAAIHQELGA